MKSKRQKAKGKKQKASSASVIGGAFAVSCLLFCAQGCATLSRPARLDPNASPRQTYLRIADNYRLVQSFRGTGRLVMETPKVQFDAPATILTIKPDSLFIKVEALFGVDVGFFFADGKTFESYSPLENTLFFGEIGEIDQLMLFQMKISYEEILSGITGAVLPPFDSTFAMSVNDEAYRFDGTRASWQVSYWVDPEKGVVTKAEQRDSKGALHARQSFRRFRRVDGVWLPQLIQIEKPAHRERATVYYSRSQVNKDFSTNEFQMRVPNSARRIRLSSADSLGSQETTSDEVNDPQ